MSLPFCQPETTLGQTVRQLVARWQPQFRQRNVLIDLDVADDTALTPQQRSGLSGALAIILADLIYRSPHLKQIWIATIVSGGSWEVEVADDDLHSTDLRDGGQQRLLAGPLFNALSTCGSRFEFGCCPEGGIAITLSGKIESKSVGRAA